MIGATKVCEHCGCTFVIPDKDTWAYKRRLRMPGEQRADLHWFHTWSCLTLAQREADEHFADIRAKRMAQARQRMREYSAERYTKQKEQRTT